MASYRKQSKNFNLNFEKIQLGLEASPAQIVSYGFPSDAGKGTTSVHMLLKDPVSIEIFAAIEQELEMKAKPEGFTVNSSILRTVTVDGITLPVIRCKFTKDPNNYSTKGDAWTTGAAVNLTGLTTAHSVMTICNPVVWCRQKECGITLYVNSVCCTGKVEDDEVLGRREMEPICWK